MILNGWGVGTDHFGAYAEVASMQSRWLIPRPASLSSLDAARIGTAGYTAMLCIDALERNGVEPSQGKILVTGTA